MQTHTLTVTGGSSKSLVIHHTIMQRSSSELPHCRYRLRPPCVSHWWQWRRAAFRGSRVPPGASLRTSRSISANVMALAWDGALCSGKSACCWSLEYETRKWQREQRMVILLAEKLWRPVQCWHDYCMQVSDVNFASFSVLCLAWSTFSPNRPYPRVILKLNWKFWKQDH